MDGCKGRGGMVGGGGEEKGGSCVHVGREFPVTDRLVGLVVKASASRAEDPGFESRLRRDFFRDRVIPVT